MQRMQTKEISRTLKASKYLIALAALQLKSIEILHMHKCLHILAKCYKG